MNQILSQDEVDALLRGLDTGEVDTDKESLEPIGEYQPYDWNTQGRDIKGSMPVLSLVNQRLAKAMGKSLSSSLRRMVEVDAGPLEIIKFEEFQRSLPIPTSLHLFKMDPLRGTGMLVIASRLVFNLVEAYFGGSGTGSTKVEGRDFTPIERKIIGKVVDMALGSFRASWEEVHPVRTNFLRSESNPMSINAVSPSEFLISVKFEIELTKSSGSIIFCLPYSSIQPIREKLSGTYRRDEIDIDKLWVRVLEDQLKDTELDLSIDLGVTHLPVKEYMSMKKGDILILEKSIDDKLVARVRGIPKLEGFAGRCRDKKAFRVMGPIERPQCKRPSVSHGIGNRI